MARPFQSIRDRAGPTAGNQLPVRMSPHPARSLNSTSAFTAEDARAQGVSLKALQHRVRTGELVRLRRGVYAPARSLSALERIESALLTAPALCVVANEAAAALLELPIPHSKGLSRVDLYVPAETPRGGGRPAHEVRLHYVEVPTSQVTSIDGIPCTSLARTAIDISCGQPIARAVIALDAARRRGVSVRELIEARTAASGRRGVAVVDRAIDRCSASAESPLESMSRITLEDRGVRKPELQTWLSGASGRRYRVDFYWRAEGLVGEADGIAKYNGRLEELKAEKSREDDLRLAGFGVVRWTWPELVGNPELVVARVRSALARRRLP